MIQNPNDGRLQAYLNTGKGFRQPVYNLGLNLPVEEVQSNLSNLQVIDQTRVFFDGERGHRSIMRDVDGDGLNDVLVFEGDQSDIAGTTAVTVHYGVGDHFLPGRPLFPGIEPAPACQGPCQYTPGWAYAKRLFRAEDGMWHQETDFVDGDGDGLPDLVRWLEGGGWMITTDGPSDFPPRALASVDNGRGLTVQFSYGPSTDPDVVDWDPDANQHYLPGPRWVVRSVDISGGYDTPPLVTRYEYRDPVFQSRSGSEATPAQFLGFAEVVTTSPGVYESTAGGRIYGSSTNRRYRYDLLPDPLLSEEYVYEVSETESRLHQHKSIGWEQLPLFNGALTFTHKDITLTRTCNSGEPEADCLTKDTEVLRQQEDWTPWNASVCEGNFCQLWPTSLYLLEGTQEGIGAQIGAQDRKNTFEYQVRYGYGTYQPADYRALTRRSVADGANEDAGVFDFITVGKGETLYDDAGHPVQSKVWQDENTVAVTRRSFDLATGNLLTITDPEQAKPGGSNKKTTYTYGPHQLFVRTTTNELGHRVETFNDAANGNLIQRLGPNSKTLLHSCSPGDGIGDSPGDRPPADCLEKIVLERETWKYDGLSREVARSVSFDDTDLGYRLNEVGRTTYFDSEAPNRVREEKLIDLQSGVYAITDRTFDGLGRLLAETQQLDHEVNSVTTYRYDAAGDLSIVEVPDPSQDDSSTVDYRYDRDGLGRRIRFTTPDGLGIQVSHSGLNKTTTEITQHGSGSKTLHEFDPFGRFVEVHEHGSDPDLAVTRYQYDPNNNLRSVVDAEGNETKLVHDWTGNRVLVSRGSDRDWRYEYDLHGNLTRSVLPAPDGAFPETYTYEYDDLDRVANSIPDSRVPGSERMAQLGVGPISYSYDTGINSVGRLSQVTLPFGDVEFQYEARGLVAEEKRSFQVDHLATARETQVVTREYNAFGQPTATEWDDGQKWFTTYDERGLVSTVQWFDPTDNSWKKVANYQRSVTGQPVIRQTDFNQRRAYTYDQLGRVDHDVVLTPSPAGWGPVSLRNYDYTDTRDVAAVRGFTNGMSADETYSYDLRHRLLSVAGPNGYSGAFSYSPTGNIETSNVTWNGSPDTRNVQYEYGAVDPQAVDSLIDTGSGLPYADFDYDPAGRMVRRHVPEGLWDFVWDGEDRLRQATGPNGTEVYYYDHNGQRMLAIHPTHGVRFWFGASETHYDATGTQLRRYLHLSDGGSTVARVENGSAIELQYSDALQNLVVSLDDLGDIVASFLYGPFGEVVQATGETHHRRQFNGKENDNATGLRYYGFRYYDPLALRWNSGDPLYRLVPELGLMSPQRMNQYSFSLNNPVRYLDPDGRDSKDPKPEEGDQCGPSQNRMPMR